MTTCPLVDSRSEMTSMHMTRFEQPLSSRNTRMAKSVTIIGFLNLRSPHRVTVAVTLSSYDRETGDAGEDDRCHCRCECTRARRERLVGEEWLEFEAFTRIAIFVFSRTKDRPALTSYAGKAESARVDRTLNDYSARSAVIHELGTCDGQTEDEANSKASEHISFNDCEADKTGTWLGRR